MPWPTILQLVRLRPASVSAAKNFLPIRFSAVLALLACCHASIDPLAAVEPATVPLEIYVATTGVDTASGAKGSPVASPAQAQKLARKLIAAGTRDVSVRIAGGTYWLDEPLVFTPADCGAAPFLGKVTWQADGQEPVIFSGGRPLVGWKEAGDVWQLELPEVRAGKWWFEDLYVGGARRPLARFPHEGFLRVEKAGPDSRTSFFFRPGDLKNAPDIAQAHVVFLHDWSTSQVRVKSIDDSARQIFFTDPIGPNGPIFRIDNFEPHPRYFLEGARSFLAAPGEWHLDRATGVLTYKPLPGEKLAEFHAVAPRLENLITVRGEKEKGVLYLSFRGFTFSGCGWPLPPHGAAESQACFFDGRASADGKPHRESPPAMVQVDFANCLFENCRFENSGGTGLWFRQDCSYCRAERCVFRNHAGNGVMIGETVSRPAPEVTRGVTLENCLVENCGQRYLGAVGVWLGLVSDCKVRHCEIRKLPYTGISVGWQWNPQPTSCARNEIRGNLIHDVMLTLSDGGGIYTLGRQEGTTLDENRIYNIPANAGRAESNGMFLDEGSSEIVIRKNTIYNVAKSPLRFHQATKLFVRYNTLVSHPQVPTYRYNSTDEKTIFSHDNREVTADNWQPPADDATMNAGILP